MAGLQRSAQTFRRSGSSGLVWDERFLTDGGAAAAAEDGGGDGARGSGRRRQPELRHSRSVGSMLMRRGEAAEHGGDMKRTRLAALAKAKPKQHKDQEQRRRQKEEEEVVVALHGRTAFRTRDVAPTAEPPSPRVPAGCCAPCAIFRAPGTASTATLPRRAKPRKR